MTKYLAIDTETTGLDWWGDHYAFLVTTSDADSDWAYDLAEEDARADLYEQVETATDLIMFNAQFDIHMLVKTGLWTYDDLLAKEIHDASILSRMLLRQDKVAYSYRLKNIADVILGEGASDEEAVLKEKMYEHGIITRQTQKNFPDGAYLKLYELEPDILTDYALKDTRITWDLYFALLVLLESPEVKTGEDREEIVRGLKRVWDIERATQKITTRMEARGVQLDQYKMGDLTTNAEGEILKYEQALAPFTPIEGFDPDSPKQVADVLLAAGVPLTEMTDTGTQLRTDKFVLEKHRDHPAVDALLGYRLYSKFLNTYLYPWGDREVLNPGINSIGTWTGRMSSMRPNMQNIPTRSGPKVREALVPREGMSMVVADYSSIELRVLAYYMNDDDFWDLVLNNDVFLWMGEQIYGTPDQDSWPVSRSSLKNAMYAIIYGGGGAVVANTVGGGMTPDDGKALLYDIKGTLGPAFAKLNNRVRQKVQRTGCVTTLAGRRQQIPPNAKTGRIKDYLGLSAVIQGSAADVMKLGLYNVAQAAPLYGAHLLLPVHDEALTEAPTEAAEEWGNELGVQMEAATDNDFLKKWGLELTHPLPLKAEAVICHNNYAEAK